MLINFKIYMSRLPIGWPTNSVLKCGFVTRLWLLLILVSCAPWAVWAAVPERSETSNPDSISSIQTLSPYCFQPDAEINACFINFAWHQVSSTSSMRSLRVTINGKSAVEDRGFFQSTLTVEQYKAMPPGVQVACGAPGAGSSDLQLGNLYSYQITAIDSDNFTSNNYGSIGCPAYFSNELFKNGFESK